MKVPLSCALAFAIALAGGVAHAQSDVERARAAYDRGVRAHAAGNHAAAAHAFAEADALAPSPASLEAALESAMRADDAPLGAELVDRSEGRANDAGVARSLAAAKRRFAGRTGKIKVDCQNADPCLASVDGVAADAKKTIYVVAGPHDVVVQRGERLEKLVEVKADSVTLVGAPETPVPPPAHVEPPPTFVEHPAGSPSPTGLSPVWFYAGLGLTAVAGAFTIGSGVDANKKHDTFTNSGCGPGATGPLPANCNEQSDDGHSAQTRTNVLVVTTAVLAVATGALGLFAVEWKPALAMSRTGAFASLEIPLR